MQFFVNTCGLGHYPHGEVPIESQSHKAAQVQKPPKSKANKFSLTLFLISAYHKILLMTDPI